MQAQVGDVHKKGVTEDNATQEGITSMVHYGMLHVYMSLGKATPTSPIILIIGVYIRLFVVHKLEMWCPCVVDKQMSTSISLKHQNVVFKNTKLRDKYR
jgi:hypothetical protein